MQIIEIITLALGGLNVVQLILLIKTMKSHVKKENALAQKEEALAEQEKANSVEKSQTIYNQLTEIMNRELGKMDAKIQMQGKTIDAYETKNKLAEQEIFQFQKRVDELQKKVEMYKTNCAQCAHNKISA